MSNRRKAEILGILILILCAFAWGVIVGKDVKSTEPVNIEVISYHNGLMVKAQGFTLVPEQTSYVFTPDGMDGVSGYTQTLIVRKESFFFS